MIAFSPVRQNPRVLELFLRHLLPEGVEVWVYDDNTDPESSTMLQFGADYDPDDFVILPKLPDLPDGIYARGEDIHQWNVAAYNRVAQIKNAAIDLFLTTSHDSLFLIDSDVLVEPGTLTHLDQAGLPILAAVYWTKWSPHHGRGPNMWGSKPEPLLEPGHHEVQGLGACTLIRREVLESGVRFDPQPGLEAEGEDRWFCRLAVEKSFPLVMCSHVEPFHVYRDSEIVIAKAWSADRLNLQPDVERLT